MSKVSEELLELRERLAGLNGSAAKLELARALYDWPHKGGVSWSAYDLIQTQRRGAGGWACEPSTTHLEVVELIQRAAVAALKAEGSEE